MSQPHLSRSSIRRRNRQRNLRRPPVSRGRAANDDEHNNFTPPELDNPLTVKQSDMLSDVILHVTAAGTSQSKVIVKIHVREAQKLLSRICDQLDSGAKAASERQK